MTDNADKAFFRASNDWFVGNGASRGPWSADACHAGPVAAVIARALERVVLEKQLTRLTISFRRSIPISGFRVDAEIERDGRSTSTAIATLRDEDDRICATASSLHLVTHSYANLPSASVPQPSFEDAESGHFAMKRALHDLPFFGSGIEVAYPPGETADPGPTTLWMRTIPIVEDEIPSPFQLLCPIADCGNGISRNAETTEVSFVNADLTVAAYRLPESDWIASQAISIWQSSGIGISQAILFDRFGSIGTALQTLVVRPVA
jgi:hypothetical protein